MRKFNFLLVLTLIAACGDNPIPTAPETVTPSAPVVSTETPKPDPPVEVVVAVPPPYCSGQPMRFKEPSVVGNRVDLKFDVDPTNYHKRGQIFITRTTLGRLERVEEFEIMSLSGPHNREVTVSFYITNPGTFSAVGRFHMPNDCRVDEGGNSREHGQYSEPIFFSIAGLQGEACAPVFYQGNGQWGCEDKGIGRRDG